MMTRAQSMFRPVRLSGAAILVILAGCGGTDTVTPVARDTGRYVVDPDRAGAPENGVRFILYAADPSGENPNPNEETGHADILDIGRDLSDAIGLRLVASIDSREFLNYTVARGAGENGHGQAIHGALTDGDDEVRFGFEVHAAENPPFEAFRLRAGFEVNEEVAVRLGVENARIGASHFGNSELNVHSDGHDLRLASRGHMDRIHAEVFIDGSVFAVITGDRDNPDVRSGSGAPLTPEEQMTLAEITRVPGHVYRQLHELQQPVALLFGLLGHI